MVFDHAVCTESPNKKKSHRSADLLVVEDDPLGEGLEDVGEVDDESEDGHGDAEDAAAQDDVHGQVVAAPLPERVHLVGGSVALPGDAAGAVVALAVAGEEAEAQGLAVRVPASAVAVRRVLNSCPLTLTREV